MKRIAVFILLSIIFAKTLCAESLTLNVDQAVARAVEKNLGLQKDGISLRTKERAKRNAWNYFLPTFSINGGLNVQSQLFTDTTGAIKDVNDDGALGIVAGGALSLPLNSGAFPGVNKLMADYEAGLLSYESAQKKLDRDVRKQFFSLLNTREDIRIQESNKALAQKRLDEARINFNNGLSSELDVLSAEVALINLQPALDAAIANYDSQLLTMKFLIGASLDDEITLEGSLDTPFYNIDSDTIFAGFLMSRPDLLSIEKRISSLKYAISALGLRSKSPTLTLGYEYGMTGSNSNVNNTIDPWSNFTDNSKFSVLLSWKLDGFIPGSSTDVQIKDLKDQMDSLILDKSMAMENASMEVRNLISRLATSRKTIEANSSGVKLAQRTYELYAEAYKAGTRKLLDVESAQNSLLKANQALLTAKFGYISGLLDLIYAANISMDELKVKSGS